MRPLPIRFHLLSRALFWTGLLVGLTAALYKSTAPRSYRAFCRVKIEPYSWPLWSELSQPAFHDQFFPRESCTVIQPLRGCSLIQVSCEGNTPQDAAVGANSAGLRLMQAIARRPGLSCELFDRSEPPLRPYKPDVQYIVAVSTIAGVLLEVGAIASMIISRRRQEIRA
jgi:hypothetical protein